MRFSDVDVSAVGASALAISWSVEDVLPPRTRWVFHLYRGESPKGPFEQVAADLVDTYAWVDEVPLKNRWRIYYYQVEAVDRQDGQVVRSDVAHLAHAPDLEALAMSRGLLQALKAGMGRPVWFLLKRTTGVRCASCFDPLLQRPLTSDCAVCYRTGFEGGYHTPIAGYADLNPSQKILRLFAIQRLESNQTTGWTCGYPILHPGDLIVEKKINKRWRIGPSIQPHAKSGHIFRQDMVLEEIASRDIEYRLEVDL